ncbi:S53 family peptidase [Leifsonia xyli]|uniref:S53 family peptidase n=1 Tax=Leifsonia xyli TaxID=1575 RepID=UPI0002DC2557|nr:S53 family peptidase [Leifsonia xyli]
MTAPAAYNGQTKYSTDLFGYTPKQLRSAYDLSSLSARGINGSGQTVVVLSVYASPMLVRDANSYSLRNGEPGLTAATYHQIVPKLSEFTDVGEGKCGSPSVPQTEQTVDIETVHAIAPGARILYVGATNCSAGVDLAMSKILDNKLANIVSNSYGFDEKTYSSGSFQRQVNLELQAAGEGIGLYYASGDYGDNSSPSEAPSVGFPTSSPLAIAVGGTSLAIDKDGRRMWETGWGNREDLIMKNTDGSLVLDQTPPGPYFYGGAGGGASTIFTAPDYQRGIVPLSLSKGHRASPDISGLADPFMGFQIGYRPIINDDTLETGPYKTESRGGTSVATPLVAAHVALAQQAIGATIGFANPALYALNRVLPSVFQDVLPQNPPQALVHTDSANGYTYLVSFDQDQGLKTEKGYDLVTGLGGVSFELFKQLAHFH